MILSRTPGGLTWPRGSEGTIHSRKSGVLGQYAPGQEGPFTPELQERSLRKIRIDDPFQKFWNKLRLQKFKREKHFQSPRRVEMPQKVRRDDSL